MAGPSQENEESQALRETLGRRERVLDTLASDPSDQRDLRDALEVSRSTAYKALRELEDAGLVRHDDDGRYRLTQFGSLVHRRHSAYVERMNRLAAARVVVEALPDDLLMPLAFVERGHLVVATPYAPEQPLERMRAITARSHDYRVLSPIAVPRFLPTIHERVERGDLTTEILVQSDAVEYLREYDRLDEALAADGFDLYRTEGPVEVGVLVCTDLETAALFAYGPQGGAVGMLLSDAPEAYRWADRTYRRYRREASRVESGA